MQTPPATISSRRLTDTRDRGYHAVYREREVNHCPGCGRSHWLIGRILAECAFCSTALPLCEASWRGHDGPAVIVHRHGHVPAWAA